MHTRDQIDHMLRGQDAALIDAAGGLVGGLIKVQSVTHLQPDDLRRALDTVLALLAAGMAPDTLAVMLSALLKDRRKSQPATMAGLYALTADSTPSPELADFMANHASAEPTDGPAWEARTAAFQALSSEDQYAVTMAWHESLPLDDEPFDADDDEEDGPPMSSEEARRLLLAD